MLRLARAIAFILFPVLQTLALAAESPSFAIYEFRVEGNSALDEQTIHSAIYPFMGEQKQLKDVDGARAALERVYQARGYQTVAVDIPPQEVKDGVVVLRVVEGTVRRLTVTGAEYVLPSAVKSRVPALAPTSVPNMQDAAIQLGALNTSTTEVTPSLKPGITPGTVDVDLALKDRAPWLYTAELTNARTANTSALRLNLGVRYLNLFQKNHQIGLNYLTTPEEPSQVQVWSANYLVPLASLPGSLVFYAVDSDSKTPSAIGGTTVLGAQRIYGARLIRLLRPAFDIRHWLTFGLDYKGLQQQDFTTLHYYPMTIGYSGVRTTNGNLTSVDLSGVFSIRDIGNDPNAFADRRFKGDSSFLAVKWDLAHEMGVGTWKLRGRFSGQTTAQPLVQSEQYAIGGSSSVRGYLEVEQFGDRALLGSLELRSPESPLGSDKLRWSLLSFVDTGNVSTVEPLQGQRASTSLAGAGAGMRLKYGKSLTASFDLATALRTTSLTQANSVRLHGRIALEY
jgi:hemolysin activation/secretion protein